jgi:CBS domain-containing protein
MNCRDVMTPYPACSLPDDSVAEAARLMKLEDVGVIPVVNDHDDRRLVGMLTDRDLATRVVAEARNPATTRVGDVMTTDVVVCRATDLYQEALQAMAVNQVRRIPVVDDEHRLLGIIAQADVATRIAQPSTTGTLVEAISEPAP